MGENMEEAREKECEGAERRAHPRFHIAFPAFLRLSVIREGNPTILETSGETVDVSLEGVKISIPEEEDVVSAIEDAKEGRGVDAGMLKSLRRKRGSRRLAISDGFRLRRRSGFSLVSI
jgi:hypothetical protein